MQTIDEQKIAMKEMLFYEILSNVLLFLKLIHCQKLNTEPYQMLYCNFHAYEFRVIEFSISHDKKRRINIMNRKENQ